MRRNFRIQTLNDNLSRKLRDENIDYGSMGIYASTGAAIGSAIPVVGTAVGAAVGAVAGFLSSLFGGGHTSDAYIVGEMRKLAEAAGFKNLTDADIVHLLPGGWGDPSKIQNTAYVFVAQLKNVAKYSPGPYPQGIFGGGYQPNHVITFTQKTNTSGGGSSSGGGGSVVQTSGGLNLNTILLFGAGIFLLTTLGKK